MSFFYTFRPLLQNMTVSQQMMISLHLHQIYRIDSSANPCNFKLIQPHFPLIVDLQILKCIQLHYSTILRNQTVVVEDRLLREKHTMDTLHVFNQFPTVQIAEGSVKFATLNTHETHFLKQLPVKNMRSGLLYPRPDFAVWTAVGSVRYVLIVVLAKYALTRKTFDRGIDRNAIAHRTNYVFAFDCRFTPNPIFIYCDYYWLELLLTFLEGVLRKLTSKCVLHIPNNKCIIQLIACY